MSLDHDSGCQPAVEIDEGLGDRFGRRNASFPEVVGRRAAVARASPGACDRKIPGMEVYRP
jgi:hypothetical protein